MKRRNFLLLASVSTLALMLPAPILAAKSTFDYFGLPINKLGMIEQALDVGEVYKFHLLAYRYALFGFYPQVAGSTAELRDLVQAWVIEYGSIDAWNRIRFLVAIRQELDNRFPADLVAQLRFMEEPRFGERSLRDLMNTTDQMDLYFAARAMGSSIEFHGFKEMRDFG